jgi:hypothetical protein
MRIQISIALPIEELESVWIISKVYAVFIPTMRAPRFSKSALTDFSAPYVSGVYSALPKGVKV